jgi:hypothetical protein
MSIKTLKLSFMALALAFGSFIGTASAQPEEGDQELQLSADFFGNHKFKSYATDIEGSYGFFLTDALEVGARLGYVGIFPDGGSSAWAMTALPFIDYHFRGISDGDKILPYVGVFGGWYFNDRDDAYALGPEAGVKFFVYDKTFINTQYRYEFFDSLNTRDASHEVRVALGFLF